MTPPESVVLHPPAKVNLFLGVGGMRPDGFHEVETLMVRVDVRDRLEMRRAERFSLVCEPPLDVPPEENLAAEAVRALEEAVGRELPVSMRLEKHIPSGAGLGGGSSDAAAALAGLNELFGLGMPREELARIAAGIGSDVPFFLYPGCVLCGGRGEKVKEHFPISPFDVCIVYPGVKVPTGLVYRTFSENPANGAGEGGETFFHREKKRDLTSKMKNVHLLEWKDSLRNGNVPFRLLHNSLCAAAQKVSKEVRETAEELGRLRGVRFVLSGSGSAFAAFPQDGDALDGLIRKASTAGWQVFRSRAVNA